MSLFTHKQDLVKMIERYGNLSTDHAEKILKTITTYNDLITYQYYYAKGKLCLSHSMGCFFDEDEKDLVRHMNRQYSFQELNRFGFVYEQEQVNSNSVTQHQSAIDGHKYILFLRSSLSFWCDKAHKEELFKNLVNDQRIFVVCYDTIHDINDFTKDKHVRQTEHGFTHNFPNKKNIKLGYNIDAPLSVNMGLSLTKKGYEGLEFQSIDHNHPSICMSEEDHNTIFGVQALDILKNKVYFTIICRDFSCLKESQDILLEHIQQMNIQPLFE